MSRISHFATVKAVLEDLEKAKVKTRNKLEEAEAARVKAEVDVVLSILDDLENGDIGLEEAKTRYRKIGGGI